MTIVPAPPPVSIETVLRDAWVMLRRNWILVAPLLLALVAIFIVILVLALAAAAFGIFTGAKGTDSSGAAGGAIALMALAMLVASLMIAAFATDALFGMADAVWTTGTTSLADGFAAARDRFGPTLAAFVGFVGLFIVAVALAIPTLGVALLAFPIVTMYVLPAVVSGRRGGFEAFHESWRLVRRHFGQSAIACLLLAALQYLITLVMYVPIVPLEFALASAGNGTPSVPSLAVTITLGALLSVLGLVMIVLLYAYQAYQALALVGLYRWLRAKSDAEDAAAAAVAPVPA